VLVAIHIALWLRGGETMTWILHASSNVAAGVIVAINTAA